MSRRVKVLAIALTVMVLCAGIFAGVVLAGNGSAGDQAATCPCGGERANCSGNCADCPSAANCPNAGTGLTYSYGSMGGCGGSCGNCARHATSAFEAP